YGVSENISSLKRALRNTSFDTVFASFHSDFAFHRELFKVITSCEASFVKLEIWPAIENRTNSAGKKTSLFEDEFVCLFHGLLDRSIKIECLHIHDNACDV
ncbi:hypothetical protein PFISCL1PPCAC_19203, partial [Pristionchus fissidentatus]